MKPFTILIETCMHRALSPPVEPKLSADDTSPLHCTTKQCVIGCHGDGTHEIVCGDDDDDDNDDYDDDYDDNNERTLM
jgi:hypothetical protein